MQPSQALAQTPVQISYTNEKGDVYYLHSTRGKGKALIYYFARTQTLSRAVFELPADREISVMKKNALPTLVKKKPVAA